MYQAVECRIKCRDRVASREIDSKCFSFFFKTNPLANAGYGLGIIGAIINPIKFGCLELALAGGQ